MPHCCPLLSLLLHLLLTTTELWCRRGEIELCARLLGIAAAGLNENPGLLGFVVGAKFALLTVMLPLLAFAGLAYTNGHLVASRHATHQACCSFIACCSAVAV